MKTQFKKLPKFVKNNWKKLPSVSREGKFFYYRRSGRFAQWFTEMFNGDGWKFESRRSEQ